MKQYPSTAARPGQGTDEHLRERLQDALSRADGEDLQVLQDRVMAQWRATVGAATPVVQGPALALRLNSQSRSLRWGVVALALVTALVWQWGRMRADGSVRDLIEPDVLSMMLPGEL